MYLAVAEAPQLRLPQWHSQVVADALRQRHICGPSENLESVVVHEARSPNSELTQTPCPLPQTLPGITLCFFNLVRLFSVDCKLSTFLRRHCCGPAKLPRTQLHPASFIS